MDRKKAPLSCDWKKRDHAKLRKPPVNKTRLSRYRGNFSWEGIRTKSYKNEQGDWAAIVRQTLIGTRGESAKFHLRYFEIAPGGFSSFEMHNHEHVVIGIRGEGICVAGKKRFRIGFLDTLYIKPKEPHQLKNFTDEPFGFFCIVNARRDRPKIIRS